MRLNSQNVIYLRETSPIIYYCYFETAVNSPLITDHPLAVNLKLSTPLNGGAMTQAIPGMLTKQTEHKF